MQGVAIAQGRHLTDFDDRRREAVCVIGPEVAEELFPGGDPIGHRIRIGVQDFEVVGLTQAKGKLFGQSQDRFVLVPLPV